MKLKKMKFVKKAIAIFLLLTLALCAATSAEAAINPPAGSYTWNGDVGYGDVQVGSRTKTDPDAVTYLTFDGAPESVKVWLTTRNTAGTVTSVKNLLNLGQEKHVSTGAVYGQTIRIYASREHWGDQVYALRGKWKP